MFATDDQLMTLEEACSTLHASESNKFKIASKAARVSLERLRNKRKMYVIQAGSMVKIGVSTNLANRIKQIQAHCPVPVRLLFSIPAARDTEIMHHARFREYREHGEWFRVEGDLADWIARQLKVREKRYG